MNAEIAFQNGNLDLAASQTPSLPPNISNKQIGPTFPSLGGKIGWQMGAIYWQPSIIMKEYSDCLLVVITSGSKEYRRFHAKLQRPTGDNWPVTIAPVRQLISTFFYSVARSY